MSAFIPLPGIAQEMSERDVACVVRSAFCEWDNMVECSWVVLFSESSATYMAFFLVLHQFPCVIFRKSTAYRALDRAPFGRANCGTKFGLFGFSVFFGNRFKDEFSMCCSGISGNIGAIRFLPVFCLPPYFQIIEAALVAFTILYSPLRDVPVLTRISGEIPFKTSNRRLIAGNNWAIVGYLSHADVPPTYDNNMGSSGGHYEGEGRHSLAAKNRARQDKIGTLI